MLCHFILICIFAPTLAQDDVVWHKFENTEYTFVKTVWSFPSALFNCYDLGADLVTPKRPETRAFLSKVFEGVELKKPPYHFFMGLSRSHFGPVFCWLDETCVDYEATYWAPDADLPNLNLDYVVAGNPRVREPELYWRPIEVTGGSARSICQRQIKIVATEAQSTIEETTTEAPIDIQANFELGLNDIQEEIKDRSPTLMYIIAGSILVVILSLFGIYWRKKRNALMDPDKALRDGDIFYTIDDLKDQKERPIRFSILSVGNFFPKHKTPNPMHEIITPPLEVAPPLFQMELPREDSDPNIFPNSAFRSSVESFQEYPNDELHETYDYH